MNRFSTRAYLGGVMCSRLNTIQSLFSTFIFFLFTLSFNTVNAQSVSPYCGTSVFHFDGNPASEVILTVENTGPTTMTVKIEGPNAADPVDDLLINGTGAAVTYVVGVNCVTGTIDFGASPPPANVTINILWSFQSFPGFWQLSQGDIMIPFDASCSAVAACLQEDFVLTVDGQAGPLDICQGVDIELCFESDVAPLFSDVALEVSEDGGATFTNISTTTVALTLDGTQTWFGFMNVFELPANGGGYIFGSPWGVQDLVALFTGDDVCLQPNQIPDPNPFWYTPMGGPGAMGNKTMEANLYVEDQTGMFVGQTVTFSVEVTESDFSCGQATSLYIREFAPGFAGIVNESFVPITTPGIYSVSLPISATGGPVQYGFQTVGPNVWETDAADCGSIKASPLPDAICETISVPADACDNLTDYTFRAVVSPFNTDLTCVADTEDGVSENLVATLSCPVEDWTATINGDSEATALCLGDTLELCLTGDNLPLNGNINWSVSTDGVNYTPYTTVPIAMTLEPAGGFFGFMNVFELPANGGGFVFNSPWGVGDLVTSFSGDTLCFQPNQIADPDPFWYTPSGGPGAMGNKTMEANFYGEDQTGMFAGVTISFGFEVTTYDFSCGQASSLYIREFAPGFAGIVNEIFIPITGTGIVTGTMPISTGGGPVQYGIQTVGPNVWATDAPACGSLKAIPLTNEICTDFIVPTSGASEIYSFIAEVEPFNTLGCTAGDPEDLDGITDPLFAVVNTGILMACNDGINLSVNADCGFVPSASQFLEGEPTMYGDLPAAPFIDAFFDVEITHNGNIVDPSDLSGYLNQDLIYTVTDVCSGASCWGTITVEDKLPPSIECPCPEGAWMTDPACQRTCLNMTQLTAGTVGRPFVEDNCGGATAVFGGAVVVEVGCGEYVVEQTWTVGIEDQYGNVQNLANTTCTNQYFVTAVDLSLVTIPGPAEFECTDLGDPNLTHPDNTGYPRLGGDNLGTADNNDNPYCNIFATYTDLDLPACGLDCSGPTKILRTWTLLDWCTGDIAEFVQIIKVIDTEAPTVMADDVFTSTGPWECAADVWFEGITVHDNCSYDLDWYIVSTNSGATLVDEDGRTNSNKPKQHALGVPKGEWEFVIGSWDCCGNLGQTTITVTVADLAAPVAISTQNLVVSLTSGGTNGDNAEVGEAKIFYTSIDNGSFDNCSGVGIEIRRDNACAGTTSGTYSNKIPAACDPWYDSNDHDYGEHVVFCCDDLAADGDGDGEADGLVKVWMRVWDDANMDGVYGSYTFYDNPGSDHDYCEFDDNFNETWSYVKVEDKGVPNLICPPNITISCDWDYTDLTITGNAAGSATCGTAAVAHQDWAELHCGEGYVLREWYLDLNGNGEIDGTEGEYTCTQTITVENVTTLPLADRVICPTVQGSNKVIVDCADYNIPDPFITESACSLAGISSDIDTFWFEEGACYKVIKTWTILDWCTGEEFACDFTVSLIDSEAPEIMCADTCIGVDDFWDADGDGNYCEFENNITLMNSATDGGDCGSPWIKWIIEVDYWADGVDIVTASSFVPPSASNYKAPTAAGAPVSMTLLKDDASAAWARHIVKWKAFDGCGNVSQCTQVVEVGDKKAPTPYCIGISTALMDSDPPLVEIWANDFNLGSFDNCSTEDQLLYTFDETAPNVDKLDQEHCFDATGEVPCSQYENGFPVQKWNPATGTSGTKFVGDDWCGENDIRVSVWDAKFNTDFCWVTLIIHGEVCDTGLLPTGSIAGTIATEAGETVEGVDVTVLSPTQPEYPRFDDTVEDGYYAFMDNLMYNTYQVSADKTGDWLNGVSTLDLVLIQRHILQLQSLDSGYKLIAADINSDQNISGIDIVELRKLILGIYDELPQNDSWRFPIEGQTMTMDPFPFTEAIDIVGLDADMMEEDFVGVKIGDVNGSVTANLLDIDVDTRSASTVGFETEALGQNLIEVRAGENFTDVYGYQFTMQLNGTLVGVRSGALNVDGSNFGILKDGVISTSFSGVEANTFAEGEVLFTLEVAGGTDLSLVSGVTSAEAYVGSNLDVADVSMRGGNGEVAEFALAQNEPNPFGETTQIGFTLGKAGQATLTVMDVTGKVVTVVSGDYDSGSHVIELTKGQLGASGVMYYQLESGDFTATKKMIVIE